MDAKLSEKVRRDLAYVRQHYGVPATIGGTVLWTGGGGPSLGRVIGIDGQYLLVLLDHHQHVQRFHPRHELTYLVTCEASIEGDAALASALCVAADRRLRKSAENAKPAKAVTDG